MKITSKKLLKGILLLTIVLTYSFSAEVDIIEPKNSHGDKIKLHDVKNHAGKDGAIRLCCGGI